MFSQQALEGQVQITCQQSQVNYRPFSKASVALHKKRHVIRKRDEQTTTSRIIRIKSPNGLVRSFFVYLFLCPFWIQFALKAIEFFHKRITSNTFLQELNCPSNCFYFLCSFLDVATSIDFWWTIIDGRKITFLASLFRFLSDELRFSLFEVEKKNFSRFLLSSWITYFIEPRWLKYTRFISIFLNEKMFPSLFVWNWMTFAKMENSLFNLYSSVGYKKWKMFTVKHYFRSKTCRLCIIRCRNVWNLVFYFAMELIVV